MDVFPDHSAICGGDGTARCSSSLLIPTEAVRIGLDAAAGKNLEVFSPTIGRQLLERGLVDEIDLHAAPILLGDGLRLYDDPGATSIRLELVNGDDPSVAVNVRYRPVPASPEL